MPVSQVEKEFVCYVVDLMQSIGPVYSKSMFGGHGIFLDNLMFSLVADNVLYLKVDREILDEFTVKNLTAFTYHKQGKECEMSYYQAPDNALEDGEEMNIWAGKAYAAALRAASKKPKK